jgi:hypothetical protein
MNAYYVDPANGDDSCSGAESSAAWRTFAPLNRLVLAPGDRVEILSPGPLERTLLMRGAGTETDPIEVHFAPGRYDFYPAEALKRKYHISNSNGDPDGEKAIGILFENAAHVTVKGPGARMVYHGKMIEVCIDHSEHITISDMQFDYHRPTVSEFTVMSADEERAELAVHHDSSYRIDSQQILWEGEGWEYGPNTQQLLFQELDPAAGRVRRCPNPLANSTIVELSPRLLRAHGKHSLIAGRAYQVRDGRRDCVAVFVQQSKDVAFANVDFFFLHGMGLLCQFTENITLDTVSIAPDPRSGRTCAAWADCFHASGCRGKITITNCAFSGAQDDAINVHGTYLQVKKAVTNNQVKVRFMHHQTYGFLAFHPGDEIEFIHSDTLAGYADNRVVAVEMLTPREILVTLGKPVPESLRAEDVLENVTWTPEVKIRGCRVQHIPTRGFLLTTRRRVLVADNVFYRTRMPGILVACDAEKWFESGCVRDMTITGNRFVECGEAAISLQPENSKPNDSFHRNIRITENEFELGDGIAVRAKSTAGLVIAPNAIKPSSRAATARAFEIEDCAGVSGP